MMRDALDRAEAFERASEKLAARRLLADLQTAGLYALGREDVTVEEIREFDTLIRFARRTAAGE